MLGATSSDRSTRIAPRASGHQGVITPCTHGCPGPGSPRRRHRTVNVVRRDDRSHGGWSADVVPLHNPTQRQVLDYHALSEDFRLMTKSNPIGLNSCVEARDAMHLTSYILKRPELTLRQVATPVAIAYSCEECSWNGPCLTSWIRMMDRKYRFVRGRGGCSIADTGTPLWSTRSDLSQRNGRSIDTKNKVCGQTSQLCAPEDVSQKVRVVETPHPMAASRLETVDVLQPPAETKIPKKDIQDHIPRLLEIKTEEPHEREAEQEDGERRLVPRAVVHTQEGPERCEKIRSNVWDGSAQV